MSYQVLPNSGKYVEKMIQATIMPGLYARRIFEEGDCIKPLPPYTLKADMFKFDEANMDYGGYTFTFTDMPLLEVPVKEFTGNLQGIGGYFKIPRAIANAIIQNSEGVNLTVAELIQAQIGFMGKQVNAYLYHGDKSRYYRTGDKKAAAGAYTGVFNASGIGTITNAGVGDDDLTTYGDFIQLVARAKAQARKAGAIPPYFIVMDENCLAELEKHFNATSGIAEKAQIEAANPDVAILGDDGVLGSTETTKHYVRLCAPKHRAGKNLFLYEANKWNVEPQFNGGLHMNSQWWATGWSGRIEVLNPSTIITTSDVTLSAGLD